MRSLVNSWPPEDHFMLEERIDGEDAEGADCIELVSTIILLDGAEGMEPFSHDPRVTSSSSLAFNHDICGVLNLIWILVPDALYRIHRIEYGAFAVFGFVFDIHVRTRIDLKTKHSSKKKSSKPRLVYQSDSSDEGTGDEDKPKVDVADKDVEEVVEELIFELNAAVFYGIKSNLSDGKEMTLNSSKSKLTKADTNPPSFDLREVPFKIDWVEVEEGVVEGEPNNKRHKFFPFQDGTLMVSNAQTSGEKYMWRKEEGHKGLVMRLRSRKEIKLGKFNVDLIKAKGPSSTSSSASPPSSNETKKGEEKKEKEKEKEKEVKEKERKKWFINVKAFIPAEEIMPIHYSHFLSSLTPHKPSSS